MPLPHIQDPDDEDNVQLLPNNKSVHLGWTLKPSAWLKDPDNVANVFSQQKHPKIATKVVETDQHKNKKQKNIVEPALITDLNARIIVKPTEAVMNKGSVCISGDSYLCI